MKYISFKLCISACLLVACDRPENRPKVILQDEPINTPLSIQIPEPVPEAELEEDYVIEQKIRTQIEGNTSLSSYAKNINVNVVNGVITLRGMTNTLQEREWLVNLTNQIKHIEKVHIQIESLH